MVKKVISVRISEKSLERLDTIAEKENLNRSILIERAIEKYIDSYNEKKLQNTEFLLSKLSNLERKYSDILTRLNILTRQIDKLMAQKKIVDILKKQIELMTGQTGLDEYVKRKR